MRNRSPFGMSRQRRVRPADIRMQENPIKGSRNALRRTFHLAAPEGLILRMSDRQPIVSDPAFIRARAMETLFERLESLCEGAIAIDRAGNVVYVNEKYLHSLRLTTPRKPSAARSRRSSPTA